MKENQSENKKTRQGTGYITISNDNESHTEFPTTAFKKKMKNKKQIHTSLYLNKGAVISTTPERRPKN